MSKCNVSRDFGSLNVFIQSHKFTPSSFQVAGRQKHSCDLKLRKQFSERNRLVEVTQDGAICQATAKPQRLGNNMFYHMPAYSIAVTELEQIERPVSLNYFSSFL